MNAPQIAMISLLMLDLGIVLAKHGQPREGNHSVYIQIIATAIIFAILIWGDYFK